MMSSVHTWNDSRIFFKEASSIAKEYEIELHAVGNFLSKKENRVNIYGLPVLTKRYLRPVIWWKLFLRVIKSKAAIYHFHDPELIPLGLVLKVLGRKVVYDVHEDYYDAIMHKQWIPRIARKVVAKAFNILEKKCCSFFDALIFAELTYKESFHSVSCIKEDILNYPVFSSKNEKPFLASREQVNLIYAGPISEIRGAVQMVESLSLLLKAGLNVQLYLIGPVSSPELKIKLDRIINENNIHDHIIMPGKISFTEVYQYYAQADIGLALLHPIENNLKSLVTKLFEYMSMGLPIVASDFPRWETLIKDVGAGVTVNPLDSKAIALTIEHLVNHPQERVQMAQQGYRAYKERFNWKSEEKKLLDLYRRLLKN